MTRKRSYIDLTKMRKHYALSPLAVGVTSVFLSACADDRQDATIYKDAQECSTNNPQYTQECETAYQEALMEAQRTGPKYSSLRDCENEFGPNQCYTPQNAQNTQSSGSIFMPLMAGYMLGNLLSPNRYSYQPLYTSYSPYSSYRYRWITADGYDYGDLRQRRHKVRQDAFKPKPTVSRTIKRGGFGSSVRAKSSWGSSAKKGGWGG